jgi:outer membrane protein insertion porin family
VVSGVKLEGNYLDRDDEFKSLVTIRPASPTTPTRWPKPPRPSPTISAISALPLRVEAVPEIDRENNRVALVLQAEPSRRAYVRRINVSGNNRTRDEVIRREFRQFEASWYDGEKIKLSRDRVDRLGFFTEVNVETQEVPGSPDQVDLVINVEKPTGSLQLGAGFSSAEKVSLSFGIKQENVFGSGNYLGWMSTPASTTAPGVQHHRPVFHGRHLAHVDLYYRTDKPYEDQGGNYELVTTGAGAFRRAVQRDDTVFFGAGWSNSIKPGTNIPAAYLAMPTLWLHQQAFR